MSSPKLFFANKIELREDLSPLISSSSLITSSSSSSLITSSSSSMGRPPCHDDSSVKKGPWTTEEDRILVEYIKTNGHGNWRTLPKLAGLKRCGKSCRLRWTNYLRPDIKRGKFSDEEEQLIIQLHSTLGNKWSAIASHLKDRTDNEIKNYWNTCMKKKLLQSGIDPTTHQPRSDLLLLATLPTLLGYRSNTNSGVTTQFSNLLQQQQLDTAQLANIQLLCDLVQVVAGTIHQCGNTRTLSVPVHTPPVMDGFVNGEQYYCGNYTLNTTTTTVVSSSSSPELTNYSSATSGSVYEDWGGLVDLDCLNGDIWWNDVLLDQ